ncbi:Dam family site-specific DNA-(adenine-N6)-methyltransferase [Salmonella enterica]|uniref:site-specific DNA-methyltransferase (adenine-specific) n=1 Tax=Escherichia coli TaxID=562 RepID=A0AB73QLC9_ECOLX|nr:Dam family site-specific DNA-(adenine-N6)-methyltransferase [Escherichia coli]EBK5885326.1 DNA adenine methylase [Salmonella enterica]EFM2835688.1 Dam family site-specific DNA-(adenine-N6)-methyltransferase [Salmonella enterica subsp. enterica serovar Typhimurium]HAO8187023.1 Dam family site-specific DNA-(adenine-N6)-methyltransferase [Salmonella enterica subsp. enterica serovar Infantis]HAT7717985.1 Dam family site-specific DNA-(adenine-N6)-methyltransferase [Enterobacter hormaechei subsp. 
MTVSIQNTPSSSLKPLKPLYRWAGGKSKLLKSYNPHLPDLNSVSAYVEPFFGAGALFASVKSTYNQIPTIINDINPELVSLLNTIKHDFEAFCIELQELEAAYLSIRSHEVRNYRFYQRREQYWKEQIASVRASALLFFLMSTGFNGIWQVNKKTGRYGTGAGLLNHKSGLFDYSLLNEWHNALQATSIHCGSYADLDVPAGAFVYCDPPYRDSIADYGHAFTDEDHKDLIEWCRQLQERGCVVWLANREANDSFFEENASDASVLRFDITYTAGRKKKTENGHEAVKAKDLLMIWNNKNMIKAA